jgi:hypothetical protein
MYSACLFCNAHLGENDQLATLPVGERIAFDEAKGRLWVVCGRCARWNLTPLEERWETIEACERLYRGTRLRVSTDNVGLARLRSGVELVRIGPALYPEIASWRYGARLLRRDPDASDDAGLLARSTRLLARSAASAVVRSAYAAGLRSEVVLRMHTFGRGGAVLARASDDHGRAVTIRYAHIESAELIRPERDEPWRLRVQHDRGVATLTDAPGLRVAGKMLATLNFGAATEEDIERAAAKLDDAGDPEHYFSRVASLAIRTSWGRDPNAPAEVAAEPPARSFAERLALRLATRSFWAHGGTGSQELATLHRLPAIDRLALEMAANEDFERRALAGELAALRDAWRDAEELAAIADNLLADEALAEFKRRLLLNGGT